MKLSSADLAFSTCVRAAADWVCARCKIQKFPNGRRGGSGMECSHAFSRRHRTIRWAKDNAECLCSGCHRWYGENPAESGMWIINLKGQGVIDRLIEKRESRVKVTKAEEKEIAKHYRSQLAMIEQLRNEGTRGDIDFESYQ